MFRHWPNPPGTGEEEVWVACSLGNNPAATETPRAIHLHRAHPHQCLSTSPADPPFSSASAATRRAQPITPDEWIPRPPVGRGIGSQPNRRHPPCHRTTTPCS